LSACRTLPLSTSTSSCASACARPMPPNAIAAIATTMNRQLMGCGLRRDGKMSSPIVVAAPRATARGNEGCI